MKCFKNKFHFGFGIRNCLRFCTAKTRENRRPKRGQQLLQSFKSLKDITNTTKNSSSRSRLNNSKIIMKSSDATQVQSQSEGSKELGGGDCFKINCLVPPSPFQTQPHKKINWTNDEVINNEGSKKVTIKPNKKENRKKSGNCPKHHHKTANAKTGKSSKSSTDEKLLTVDTPVLKLYELRQRIGKGAYGIVWDALEKGSGRRVALKKIYEAFRNSTDSQRTYREIMFLREFGHHPNIISIIAAHRSANKLDLYLVFPYMSYDLHKVIQVKSELLTDKNIRWISYQLLVALNYLHSAEVIHRDLKPANILMDETIHVKLADFGLARALESGEEGEEGFNPILTDYVATRWYRPPEILISSKQYTKGVDMWSFGCILGEMLLKKALFQEESTTAQLNLVLSSIEIPSHEEMEMMCKGTSKGNLALIKSAVEERGRTLDEIFDAFDCATVDFIERLLCFNPCKRMRVEDALMHPFLACVRQLHAESKYERRFRPPLSDGVKLEIVDYQRAIYDMIDKNEVASLPADKQLHKAMLPSLANQNPTSTALNEEINLMKPVDGYYRVIYEDQEYLVPEADVAYAPSSSSEQSEFNEEELEHQQEEEQFYEEDELEYANECSSRNHEKHFDDFNDDNNNIGEEEETEEKSSWDNNCGGDFVRNFSAAMPKPKLGSVNKKNVSILTIPSSSENPLGSSSLISNDFSFGKPKEKDKKYDSEIISKPTQRDDAMIPDDIMKNYQTLCQKYDVELEDLDYINTESTNNRNKSSKINKGISGVGSTSSIGSSWTGLNVPSRNKPQGRLPPLKENASANNQDAYEGDLRRIQDLFTKEPLPPVNINPYKLKGLKTSHHHQSKSIGQGDSADENDIEKIYEQIEIRNSRSLPSHIGRTGREHLLDISTSKFPITEPVSYYQNHYENNHQRLRTATLSHHGNSGKVAHNLFPSKETIQNRVNQVGQKFKRGVGSYIPQPKQNQPQQPSAQLSNSTDGLILVNGKNTVSDNLSSYLQRQSAEPKSAFSFNRFGKIVEPELLQPVRPYRGRAYDKKFTGPSFKRIPPGRSYSDTDANHQINSWKPAPITPGKNSRPMTDYAGVERTSSTHSTYFPNATRMQRSKMSSTTSRNGFTTIPKNNISKTSRQSMDYIHKSDPQDFYNNSVYIKSPAPTGNGTTTIRASDLFELRNNLNRDSKQRY